MVDGIEVSADVGIKHPVHVLLEDSHRERIQRIMLTAPRPETVRTPLLNVSTVLAVESNPRIVRSFRAQS
jgi:hypothetical protein